MEGLNPDFKKGKAAHDQLRIWDRLLEIRIQFQKMLIESNKLPQNEFQALVEAGEYNAESFLTSLKNSQGSVQKLLDNLLDLQDLMTKQNPDVQKSILGKRKSEDAEDEEIPSDEEILSSEDEIEANGDNKQLGEDGGSDEEEDDSEGSEGSEEDEETKDSDRAKKRRKIEDYEAEVQKRFDQFAKYRNETVQKWNDKTQLSAGNVNKRNYSAFQTSTLSQVEHILKDRTRLIKRTQLKRSQYNVIGKQLEESEDQNQANEYDSEIFDDDDFYHQLLRELIDRKTSGVTDPVQLSRQWLQIQKLRSKLKRKVDTRASKGRKIRYDVHPKLVSYMASYDNCSMTESSVKELMSSLFGNMKE